MSRRGPRGLTLEEKDLWDKVRERTSALHPDKPKPLAQTPVYGKAVRKKQKLRPDIQLFQIGEGRTETAIPNKLIPPLHDRLAAQSVQMDSKKFGRLKRGKLTPEARVDLHGMTLDQAHGALNRVVLDAYAKSFRLVLVITGKGKQHHDDGPIPVRRGALRHQVPQWLHGPRLHHVVLQVVEAHQKHGGSGAYYVYLRRPRRISAAL